MDRKWTGPSAWRILGVYIISPENARKMATGGALVCPAFAEDFPEPRSLSDPHAPKRGSATVHLRLCGSNSGITSEAVQFRFNRKLRGGLSYFTNTRNFLEYSERCRIYNNSGRGRGATMAFSWITEHGGKLRIQPPRTVSYRGLDKSDFCPDILRNCSGAYQRGWQE